MHARRLALGRSRPRRPRARALPLPSGWNPAARPGRESSRRDRARDDRRWPLARPALQRRDLRREAGRLLLARRVGLRGARHLRVERSPPVGGGGHRRRRDDVRRRRPTVRASDGRARRARALDVGSLSGRRTARARRHDLLHPPRRSGTGARGSPRRGEGVFPVHAVPSSGRRRAREGSGSLRALRGRDPARGGAGPPHALGSTPGPRPDAGGCRRASLVRRRRTRGPGLFGDAALAGPRVPLPERGPGRQPGTAAVLRVRPARGDAAVVSLLAGRMGRTRRRHGRGAHRRTPLSPLLGDRRRRVLLGFEDEAPDLRLACPPRPRSPLRATCGCRRALRRRGSGSPLGHRGRGSLGGPAPRRPAPRRGLPAEGLSRRRSRGRPRGRERVTGGLGALLAPPARLLDRLDGGVGGGARTLRRHGRPSDPRDLQERHRPRLPRGRAPSRQRARGGLSVPLERPPLLLRANRRAARLGGRGGGDAGFRRARRGRTPYLAPARAPPSARAPRAPLVAPLGDPPDADLQPAASGFLSGGARGRPPRSLREACWLPLP